MKNFKRTTLIIFITLFTTTILMAATYQSARSKINTATSLQRRAERVALQNRNNRTMNRKFRQARSRLSAAKSYLSTRRYQTAYDYANTAINEFNQIINSNSRNNRNNSSNSNSSNSSNNARYWGDYHIKLAERYKRQAVNYIRNSRYRTQNRRWNYLYYNGLNKLNSAKNFFSQRDYNRAKTYGINAQNDLKRYLGRMGARVQ